MTVTPDQSVEFSRKLRLDRLAAGDVETELVASPEERQELARRFGVLGIESLSGQLRARRPAQGPLIRVEGSLSAEVRQTCVVTLEAFVAEVTATFVQLYTLEPEDGGGEVFVSPEDEETPEPLRGDALDLGEVLAEELALALEPYPRKPGVTFEGASYGTTDEGGDREGDEGETPFAILKHLKNGR